MRVVLADPIAYLGTRYEIVVDRKVPAGSYPVELSVCLSRIAGLRIAAARLLLREEKILCWNLHRILICWNIRMAPTCATERNG